MKCEIIVDHEIYHGFIVRGVNQPEQFLTINIVENAQIISGVIKKDHFSQLFNKYDAKEFLVYAPTWECKNEANKLLKKVSKSRKQQATAQCYNTENEQTTFTIRRTSAETDSKFILSCSNGCQMSFNVFENTLLVLSILEQDCFRTEFNTHHWDSFCSNNNSGWNNEMWKKMNDLWNKEHAPKPKPAPKPAPESHASQTQSTGGETWKQFVKPEAKKETQTTSNTASGTTWKQFVKPEAKKEKPVSKKSTPKPKQAAEPSVSDEDENFKKNLELAFDFYLQQQLDQGNLANYKKIEQTAAEITLTKNNEVMQVWIDDFYNIKVRNESKFVALANLNPQGLPVSWKNMLWKNG